MERWNLPTENGKMYAFIVISTKQPAHNAVTRNGEKCAKKFKFIFRKKFYLTIKYSFPKSPTDMKSRDVSRYSLKNRGKNKKIRNKFGKLVTFKLHLNNEST